jgi:hypothetical protein
MTATYLCHEYFVLIGDKLWNKATKKYNYWISDIYIHSITISWFYNFYFYTHSGQISSQKSENYLWKWRPEVLNESNSIERVISIFGNYRHIWHLQLTSQSETGDT